MHAAVADIRNDCELQDNGIVQGHAVIFNFFCRSLRSERPLLANHFSPLPSSKGTVERKFLRPCELRFPENKLNTSDVCWPAKRDSDDLWAGLSGAPAGFVIGIKDVLYRCVVGLRGNAEPGDCLDAKPFIAGKSSRVIFVSQNRFSHCLFPRLRVADPPVFNSLLKYVDVENRLGCTVSFGTNSVWEPG